MGGDLHELLVWRPRESGIEFPRPLAPSGAVRHECIATPVEPAQPVRAIAEEELPAAVAHPARERERAGTRGVGGKAGRPRPETRFVRPGAGGGPAGPRPIAGERAAAGDR